MEDKYFNEFFDKLYNGKLNIYEDEEDVNLYEGTKTPEQNFDDFLRDVNNALTGQTKSLYKKKTQKQSLNAIINPDVNYKDESLYSYAYEKNRDETRRKFNEWCGKNTGVCKKIKEMFPYVVKLSKWEEFLRDVNAALDNTEFNKKQRQSLNAIINPDVNYKDESLYSYAHKKNKENTQKEFNKWCVGNTDNCKKIKKMFPNPFDTLFNTFLSDVKDNTEFNKKQIQSLNAIIFKKDYADTSVLEYAYNINREEIRKKFEEWCVGNTDDCKKIKKIVNEWQIQKEWIRYEESFAKCYDGTQYFINLNKGERDFNESRIHNLGKEKINIPEIINKLTKDCTDNDLCDLERKEQVEKRITKVVRDNIETFLDHEETKVKKFDLECLEPLKLNGETIIDKNYRIEVKMKTMLDGVFATYLSSPIQKKQIDTYFGKQIYGEFVDDLLKGDKFIFERIIWDNCKHFDGIILTDNIFVPKEYITLYISSINEYHKKNKVFTLRYNIDKSEMDNFYKIIKPRDNKDDGKISKPLGVRKLNDKEKSKLGSWYSDFTGKIYSMGKCPKKRSMDESYYSYLDQLVENFFNTGKLFP